MTELETARAVSNGLAMSEKEAPEKKEAVRGKRTAQV